jgi:hypothetical protein
MAHKTARRGADAEEVRRGRIDDHDLDPLANPPRTVCRSTPVGCRRSTLAPTRSATHLSRLQLTNQVNEGFERFHVMPSTIQRAEQNRVLVDVHPACRLRLRR